MLALRFDRMQTNPIKNNDSGLLVQAKDVVKRFPESGLVVDHVSLTIEPGEIVALLGPSGCGKSTFLRMIADLEAPTSGAFQIEASCLKGRRSFVFQEAHLVPWRTVLDNVALPLELLGRSLKEARARAEVELQRVGLKEAVSHYPAQLSGGMKMRVSVARALVTEPTLLLLDEPFSALDERTRHALQEELRRIWETRGLTVVFVTHSVNEAVFIANRAVVFSKRPARVLYDAKVGLPDARPPEIRTEPVFLEELKKIYRSVPFQESPL